MARLVKVCWYESLGLGISTIDVLILFFYGFLKKRLPISFFSFIALDVVFGDRLFQELCSGVYYCISIQFTENIFFRPDVKKAKECIRETIHRMEMSYGTTGSLFRYFMGIYGWIDKYSKETQKNLKIQWQQTITWVSGYNSKMEV